MSANTTYAYAVTAFDAAGNSSSAATLSVTTPSVDTTAPSAPSNLSGTRAKPRQVILSWKASTDNVGVAGYRVYRGDTLVGTTTSLSYTDRPPRKTFVYVVVAYDAAGNSSPASNQVTV